MTTTDTTRTSLTWVGTFVDQRVREIQEGYRQDRPDAVAALARLRRGAGRTIEEAPDLWGLALDDRFYENAPRIGEEEMSRAENAAHIALTLYAVHQQSRRDDRMHQRGRGLGEAVRRLMPPGEIEEPLRRRFVQAGSATTVHVLAYRLREIVTLLRRDAIPLDYGLLADQIHQFRTPEGAKKVRAAWGRGFHAYRPKATQNPAPGTGTSTDTTDKDHS
ncbi:type I-E CRISPR-associated protein Cse2/CasB [Thermobifida halotolerans]|uniref:Type I-E CRISPR-associated protein Cse2/CasB n=1 Tax=Thermobifida halotolerans TaxID=483545 RepID=A0A399FVK4_9ACTN|nr:type I-E CRISPR-associated protein Cse2/CasB [Thermobifida halotolerans]UOE19005.1 type I-E CRISPR-associated protein Cse2/CasB [Thermobifida halotolerans]